MAVPGAFKVKPRNFVTVVKIKARVLNSRKSEADSSFVAAAVAIP